MDTRHSFNKKIMDYLIETNQLELEIKKFNDRKPFTFCYCQLSEKEQNTYKRLAYKGKDIIALYGYYISNMDNNHNYQSNTLLEWKGVFEETRWEFTCDECYNNEVNK